MRKRILVTVLMHIFNVLVASICATSMANAESPLHYIDVLGLADHSLINQWNGDPEAKIVLSINYANNALKNSKARFRYRLVHVEAMSFSGSKLFNTALTGALYNKKIRALRMKYRADFVVYMTQGSGGLAYMQSLSTRGEPFSQNPVVVGMNGLRAVAHEFGHSLSLGHGEYNMYVNARVGSMYKYGRGYGVKHELSTVMTYGSLTPAYGWDVRVLPYFSNPKVTYNGMPTGVPAGQPHEADAVRVMNLIAPMVAKSQVSNYKGEEVQIAQDEILSINGSMEGVTYPWVYGSNHATKLHTADKYAGKSSLMIPKRVTNGSDDLHSILGHGAVKAGHKYQFKAWVKALPGSKKALHITTKLSAPEKSGSMRTLNFLMSTDRANSSQWAPINGALLVPFDYQPVDSIEKWPVTSAKLIIVVDSKQPYLIDEVELKDVTGLNESSIQNILPVAKAGADLSVKQGTRVTLNGNQSHDSDGSIMDYQWKEGGDFISLRPSFRKIFGVGIHHITLTVTDDAGATASDSIRITVKAKTTTKPKPNKPPVAKAGADLSVKQGTRVTLNGNQSHDSDGSIKGYQWKKGKNLLSTNTSFRKVFGVGIHHVTLTVTDDAGATASDSIRITVKAKTTIKPKPNKPPVAKAGADQRVKQGIRVTLNGNQSHDSDGSIMGYQWKEGNKLLSTKASFRKIFGVGVHHISLMVTDETGATSSDSLKITVKAKVQIAKPVKPATSSYQSYRAGVPYIAGDRVSNMGIDYQCKPFPYSGWCGASSLYYAPGTGIAWHDAWNQVN